MKTLALILGLACLNCHGEDDMGDIDKQYASKGGWQAGGLLTVGNAQSGVALQQSLKRAQVVTAQFACRPAQPAITEPNTIKAIATIRWSVSGSFITRQVNCVNGMSISAPADQFNIEIADASVLLVPHSGDPTYPASVQVTPGPRASFLGPPVLDPFFFELSPDLTPTRYFGEVGVGPGLFVRFPVPKEAGVILSMVQVAFVDLATTPPLSTSDYRILEIDPNKILSTYHNLGTWEPVRSGTEYIQVHNEHASESVVVSCIYGIDG